MAPKPARRIVVGVTGASGAEYARTLVRRLCDAGVEVHLVVSQNGKRLFMDELGVTEISAETILDRKDDRMVVYPHRDIGAVIASGSFKTDGMIICPCSSNTLGALASGLGDNLITRAAAVTMKEVRRLVVVPREMPMGRIDLLNALRLNESGAIICPASPGFYMMPSSVSDLVEFVVGKLLDLLDVPHEFNTRWADQLAAVGFSPDRSEGA
jgi:4-hydroxy-3-polyprenylbenzoate decarboxylase